MEKIIKEKTIIINLEDKLYRYRETISEITVGAEPQTIDLTKEDETETIDLTGDDHNQAIHHDQSSHQSSQYRLSPDYYPPSDYYPSPQSSQYEPVSTDDEAKQSNEAHSPSSFRPTTPFYIEAPPSRAVSPGEDV